MTEELPKRSVERSTRVEWLQQNAALWQDVDPKNFKTSHQIIKEIAVRLHREGLYSPKTILADIEMGVFKLIRKLLKEKTH